jgi:hypothetical protein
MKQEKKILIIIFLCSIWTFSVRAQETIPATGGNASGSGGSVSYTVGQVTSSVISGTNGSIIQGVQQPYEISVITGIEDAGEGYFKCTAYPNPATDFITLKVDNRDNKDLSFQLFDINGTLLENKKLESNETSISMENYKPSIYFLKVTEKTKVVKTFKIIKN